MVDRDEGRDKGIYRRYIGIYRQRKKIEDRKGYRIEFI